MIKESLISKATIETMDEDYSQGLTNNLILEIIDEPVMVTVLEVLSILGKHGEVSIKANGNLISNAVTISLIITEKMMKGNSKIHKITVDSETIQQMGRSKSTIEITLRKV